MITLPVIEIDATAIKPRHLLALGDGVGCVTEVDASTPGVVEIRWVPMDGDPRLGGGVLTVAPHETVPCHRFADWVATLPAGEVEP
ncbi:hypothetical protein [Thermoactinospora rubra]|uniref:hypothetical protein n=1 Tax=Thermoactinospora rubra TaxID=1088767 RepID=UPI000A12246E|nr:hypothetical protein [Thermoactinospora rubra]